MEDQIKPVIDLPQALWNFLVWDIPKVWNAYVEATGANVKSGGKNIVPRRKRHVDTKSPHDRNITGEQTKKFSKSDYLSYFKDNFINMFNYITKYENQNGEGSFFASVNMTSNDERKFKDLYNIFFHQTSLSIPFNQTNLPMPYDYSIGSVSDDDNSCSLSNMMTTIAVACTTCLAVGYAAGTLVTWYCKKNKNYEEVPQKIDHVGSEKAPIYKDKQQEI